MLKNLKKYVVLALAACILFGGASSVAKADSFSFDLSGYGDSDSTSLAKGNALSYASGQVSRGNLSSSNYMNFTLYDSTMSNMISNITKMTSNRSFQLRYTVVTPSNGDIVFLKASTGYYDAYASGTWTP